MLPGLRLGLVMGLAASLLAGCGRDVDPDRLRARFDDRVVRTQVAIEAAAGSRRELQSLQEEAAEQEALAQAAALAAEEAEDLQQEQAQRSARREANRQAANGNSADGNGAVSPYAGAPASELSSQLRP